MEHAFVAEFQGKLVLWGDISAAAHHAAGNIVLWDGTRFETPPPLASITALTVWNDHIVAASPLSATVSYVLELNAGEWDTLGTANGTVIGMTTFATRLVTIGGFTSINSVTLNRIAAFDGIGWSGFGTGFASPGSPACVAVHAGDLVVGGTLSAFANVARWNPIAGTWQSLGNGLNTPVVALASDGSSLYAAGSFTKSGTTSMSGLARWDGTQWNSMGLPSGSEVHDLAVWNGKLVYDFGTPSAISHVLAWDGVTSSTLPGDSVGSNRGEMPSNFAVLRSIGTWGSKLVLTGKFFRNGTVPQPEIVMFDGLQWTAPGEPWDASMHSPVGDPITDMRVWAGRLVIAGSFGAIADGDHYIASPGIAAWDGAHWASLGEGIGGTSVWLGEYQGDLVAAGWHTGVRPTLFPGKVIRWNGTSWSAVGTNPPDFATSVQQFRTDLYVGSDVYGLSRWNGTTWSAITGEIVYSLGTSVDSLVVGGDFAALPSPNVAFWNGAAWQAAGAGVNGEVLTITNWNGRIVIGGSFTATGTSPLPGVASWDGAAWQPIGGNAVAMDWVRVIDGELYGAGDFRLPNNSVIETIARYVGPDWLLLGSGSNDYVFDAYGGYLYQAGAGVVHGHVSHGLSRRSLQSITGVPQQRTDGFALTVDPNPSRTASGLAFALPFGGRTRLIVVDVSGREVASLVDGDLESGPHEVRWSARAKPGIYFAKLDAPHGMRRTARIVRIE